jgi:epoxyqueuosine reductase
MNVANHTKIVKETAALLGFDFCGIATAGFLNEDAKRLENWLQQGMHGNMQYMQNHFDLRTDPTKLVPPRKNTK